MYRKYLLITSPDNLKDRKIYINQTDYIAKAFLLKSNLFQVTLASKGIFQSKETPQSSRIREFKVFLLTPNQKKSKQKLLTSVPQDLIEATRWRDSKGFYKSKARIVGVLI